MKCNWFSYTRFLLLALFLLVVRPGEGRNVRDTLRTGNTMQFSENKGQWEDQVLFRSVMRKATLFVERDCFTITVGASDHSHHHGTPASAKRHAYRVRFLGAKTKSVEGLNRMQGYENYFIGSDKSRWATNIGVYNSVLYNGIYDKVDMKVYAASEAMKYDFIVHPGGNVNDIAIEYEGVNGVKLVKGDLVLKTSVADIVEMHPYAYQTRTRGERLGGVIQSDLDLVEVDVRFELKDGRVRFVVGDYDKSRDLIIDPVLHFSTYTGSTADNWGTTGCYDSHKNTYSSGVVFGTGYPVSTGAYDLTYNGNCDIGIFKFDQTGSTRLYATYLGGSNADMPHSMYVNSMDELVIFGTTGSANFPVTPNAYDTSFNGGTSLQYEGGSTINFPNGSDIFICRFSEDGTQLQASTYVGGNGNDGLNYRNSFDYATIMLGNDSLYYNYGDGARGELMTDDANNIYVGSTTTSTNFPVTPNCIQSNNRGGQDGVVFKIDYNLSNIIWSTYLGGEGDDAIYSVDCDTSYNVVVCGGTNSVLFPTTADSYCPYFRGGSADGFVSKISYYGKTLMASTFFGSLAYDQSYFVRCGKNNDVFLFGQTKASGSTLIHNANYNTPNSGQFLVRFKPMLDSVVWSTVFGDGSGEPNISPTAFAVDICNRIYLSGWGRLFLGRTFNGTSFAWGTHGTSNLTVTADAYQSTTDGQDFYIMCMDMDASSLVYATYLGEQHVDGDYYSGADHVDGGTSRFDRLGTLYQAVCASCGGGDAFPVTTGAYSQHNNSDNCNNAVFRINITDDFPVAEFTYSRSTECNPTTITFHNTGRGTTFLWDFGDGTTSTDTNPSHVYAIAGFYTVRLIAYMPGGCHESDTTQRVITILAGTYLPPLDTLTTCPGTPIQIGLHPEAGITYHWLQGSVSDSNIANPTADQPGVYRVWVSSGDCGKLMEQVIVGGEIAVHILGDTVSCSAPTNLNSDSTGVQNIYQWSSNANFSDTLNNNMHDSHFSFFPSTNETIYLRMVDELGCFGVDSIHIRFYKVVDSIATLDPLCPGSCNGTATVLSTSLAQPPLQYNWGSGWVTGDSIHNDLCAGYHEIRFRDANGCTVSTNIHLNDPQPPTISHTATHIHCLENCTGSVDVTVTPGASPPYSILWLDDSSSAFSRTALCAGTHIAQITDANGCHFFDTVQILENIDIGIGITGAQNTCSDNCSGQATANVSGGTTPYTYIWSSGEETATAQQLCEGMAVVVAIDSVGCTVTDSILIEVQHSFDNIQAWADDTVIFGGKSTMLHVTPIPNATYWWSPSTSVDNPSSTDPEATLDSATLFVVTLTDSVGCTYSDSVKVDCISVNCGKPNIFIPNAFTPNGDGKNDQLCISGEWISEFHIAIFTRWGEKVYESDDITECWDGRFRNNPCMSGVYVYHCRITCADGQVSQFKGDITLIK